MVEGRTMGEATGPVGGTRLRPMPCSACPRRPEDTASLMLFCTASGSLEATLEVTVIPWLACRSRLPAALVPPPVPPLGTTVVLTQLAGTPAVYRDHSTLL